MIKVKNFRLSALRIKKSTHGFTLVESVVSIGIMAFILSMVGSLVFMGAINAYNVHDQVMAQTAASNAMERLSSLMRDANAFIPYDADRGDTTLKRVMFRLPPTERISGTAQTGVLCFKPGTNGEPGELQVYDDADAVTFSGSTPVGNPTRRYPNIRNLEIFFESDYRIEVRVSYDYRGFAFVFARPERPMVGRFTTEIIAKNHFLGFGPNGYSDAHEADTTTAVSLY